MRTLREPTHADNVSLLLRARAAEHPGRVAIVGTDGARTTFEELERRCDAIALGLRELGLGPGQRTLLFVRPGPELIALTHALFRLGAVPVLIDPGMGREALLGCVERVRPRALIGVPRAHVARLFFPRPFRSVELAVTVGRRLGWPGVTLRELEHGRRGELPPGAADPDSTAAILFTSGSTGPPKGVVYTHAVFRAQLRELAALYGLEPGETDVACFPLFALFDNALGMTSVFPELDPSRPGACDPARIHAALEREQATFTFGSPAIWTRVLAWARRRGARFTTLRRLTIAGAPVAPRLLAGLRRLLPSGGDVHTPYGATEALPVASVSGSELEGGLAARSESGEGTCVGRPAPGIRLRILPISDGPLERCEPGLEVAPGEPGEVCVQGEVVTPAYADDPAATRLAKIPVAEADGGGFWHRMGDVGRIDREGRLWFLGRKAHRLETGSGLLLPVPVENVCNTLPGVRRSALVGVGPRGSERPHLVVVPELRASRRALRARVHEAVASGRLGAPVEEVHFRRSLPVDPRHNAKIERGELKRWAEERVP